MITLLGKYLKKIGVGPSKIAGTSQINPKRISLLSTDAKTKPYADEFYKIIYLAHHHAGMPESKFQNAIDEIFPNRSKVDLLKEFANFSPEGKFFKKYTQRQTDIEKKLKIPNGKISKYFGDPNKKALAIEIIAFAESMNLDVLAVLKEIYGEVKLNNDNTKNL